MITKGSGLRRQWFAEGQHEAGQAVFSPPKSKEHFPADMTHAGETKAPKLWPALSRAVTRGGGALAGPDPRADFHLSVLPAAAHHGKHPPWENPVPARDRPGGQQSGSQGRQPHWVPGALWNALYQSHSTKERTLSPQATFLL